VLRLTKEKSGIWIKKIKTLKTGTSFSSLISLIIIQLFIISSCRNTNNVISSGIIQKRKYNKGYFVNVFPKRQKVSKIQIPNNQTTIASSNQTVTKSGNNTDNLIASTDDIKQTVNKPTKPVIPDEKNIRGKQNNTLAGRIINKVERRLNISLPFGRDDGKRVINKDALIGFFCGITTPVLLIVLAVLSISGAGSVVLDIVGIAIVVCAVCALTYSRSGLNQIKHFPDIFKGKGYALVGFILGMIEVAIMLTTLLIIIIAALAS
jgi:hypothetical protein